MPPRYENKGQARFLTFSCHNRLPLFNNDKIKDLFVEHLRGAKSQSGYRLCAWVVMPEHVHLLVIPNLPSVPMRDFLMALKRPFAQEVLGRWDALKAPILDRLQNSTGSHRFWLQGGGYDRNVRSMDEYREKLTYIEENPTRRGLVDDLTEWRWSSWWWRQREGYGGGLVDSWTGV